MTDSTSTSPGSGSPAVSPYQAITPERHTGSWWQPSAGYEWAAREAVIGLMGSELARAALSLPIAFVKHGETFLPTMVAGLEMGVNLFVGEDGRWTGGYVPALLRARPFAFLPATDGRKILCIDETAGRVSQQQSQNAQPFFAEDGKLSEPLQQFMNFLTAIEASREPTLKACAVLQSHNLLVPWTIELKTDHGVRQLEGLYRVDEVAMNALADDAYLELRRVGAIPVAYAQLMSMPHLAALGQRASARLAATVKLAPPVTSTGDLDLSFLERGDTLRF
jgi:hypothetical protein